MPASSRKRLTLFAFLILVMGSLVVALWQYHQMVVAIYDGASASVYRRMLRPFGPAPDALGQKPIRIALLHPETPAASDLEADNIEGLARQWERTLAAQRFGYRRIRELGSILDLADFNVLIVPGGAALDKRTVATVKGFVRQGGGVVMSWAAGTRDAQGRWQPSSLLQEVAGLDLEGPAPQGAPNRVYVDLDPGSPLTLGVEPGFVLSLTRFDQPLTARIREPRARSAGSWIPNRHTLTHSPTDFSGPRDRAVIAHGDYHRGRFVWIGFTIAAAAPEPEQRQAFEQVLRNAIAWVTRQPMAFKPHWPENIDSAFSLAWSLEQPGAYDPRIPELATSYRIPLVSYVSPAFLEDAPDRVRELAAFGQAGLLLIPPDDENPDQPPSLRVLNEWRQRLAQLNGDTPIGSLLPLATASSAWLEALAESGFDYVASPDSAHLLPRLARTYRAIPVLARAHELWMLPDTPAYRPRPLPDGAFAPVTATEWLFESVHTSGGLLHMSFPAERVDDALVADLDRLLANIRRKRVWAISGAKALDYYRTWGHLRISTDYPTPNRYVIQVSNTGTRTASDLTVFLRLAAPHRSMDITPTTLGTPPVYPTSLDGVTWRFDVPRIQAGKNFIYHAYRIP